MAYDEKLALRVRDVLAGQAGLVEKKMFGGVAFMVRGHMCAGIVKHDLMLRVGPEGSEEALSRPHVRPMDFTGRPMKGMVYVGQEGISTDAARREWIGRALAFTSTLPPK